MTEENKIELKKRCDKLITQTSSRKVNYFSSERLCSFARAANKFTLIPRFTFNGRKREQGRGLLIVFKTYIKCLIEESLKYPTDIYIPYIGILRIREIDSVGKRKIWKENGEYKYRMDTAFDKTVLYRIYHQIFGAEDINYQTPFRLSRTFVSPIIGKIYKLHPEGNYYPKYIKKQR
jgi:hypothetical protein